MSDWPLTTEDEGAAVAFRERAGAADKKPKRKAAGNNGEGLPDFAAKPSMGRPPLTDMGNAERLVARHGRDLRYCWVWGKWLTWDGRRWRVDDTGTVLRFAKEAARGIYHEAGEAADTKEAQEIAAHAHRSQAVSRLAAMVELAKSEEGVPLLPEVLDTNPWFLNCRNGTLDLRTGKLRKHDRGDYLTKLCPTRYEPEAECPTWKAFLNRIFDGDSDLIAFLQRLLGYCLSGDVSEHVLPIMWGAGANGKSTLIGAVLDVLGGDYAIKAPRDLLMLRRGERHPTELADLFGKRFVAAVETAEGARLDESLAKELTGGDAIRARRMREDYWGFRPTHKLVLATNHRPTIRDTTHSTWRRVRLIPFTVTIPDDEQDKHLPQKLRAERDGILTWLVQGCLNWQTSGLCEPATVKLATSEYRSEQDVIGGFLEDCCIVSPGERERAGVLYKAYVAWCEQGGEKALNQTRFGRALTERGLEKEKAGVVWYKGVALTGGFDD